MSRHDIAGIWVAFFSRCVVDRLFHGDVLHGTPCALLPLLPLLPLPLPSSPFFFVSTSAQGVRRVTGWFCARRPNSSKRRRRALQLHYADADCRPSDRRALEAPGSTWQRLVEATPNPTYGPASQEVREIVRETLVQRDLC